MENIIASMMDVQEASEGAINNMFSLLVSVGGVLIRIAVTLSLIHI